MFIKAVFSCVGKWAVLSRKDIYPCNRTNQQTIEWNNRAEEEQPIH